VSAGPQIVVARRQGADDLVDLAEGVGMRSLAHVGADVHREEPRPSDGSLVIERVASVDGLLHDDERASELTRPVHGFGERRKEPGASGIGTLQQRRGALQEVRGGVHVAALERARAGCLQVRRRPHGDLR
jgi:hypothetical protein